MGVDAVMGVRVDRTVTDDEIRHWRHMLFSGFEDALMIQRGRPGGHSLELVDEHYGIEPPAGGSLLAVSLRGRYYGEDYERGDLPTLLGIAEMLESLTGGEVFYGGDTGLMLELLDADQRARLRRHWNEHARIPYIENDFGGEGMARPVCGFCRQPTTFHGAGPQFALARCHSCGLTIETRDNGATWTERKGASDG